MSSSLNNLNNDSIKFLYQFLSIENKNNAPSELMQLAATCKRFHTLAMQFLATKGHSRRLICTDDHLASEENRNHIVQITSLDILTFDLSRFSPAHIEAISRARFAPSLRKLTIYTNQPTTLTDTTIKQLLLFSRLQKITLHWFYPTPSLHLLSGRNLSIIEPST